MSSPDPKIIDVLNKGRDDGKPFVSLEYFPPRTAEGVKNLYARMERMKNVVKPAFSDVTWGAGGSTADLSLELSIKAHETGHVANMHLTCTNITPPKPADGEEKSSSESNPKENIRQVLLQAHKGGLRNLVALRGDPPAGESEWKATDGGFTCALDLVKFIREQPDIGNDFGIAVAGYPEGHPNAISEIEDPSKLTEAEKGRSSTFDGKTFCCLDADYKKEMDYLKEKVDAGSDLIITQMFFDPDVFIQFVKDCKTWGINCPVVPGLMCINAYNGFCKMTKFCKTRVPASLQAKMDSLKDDPTAVKEFGVQYGVDMCQALLNANIGVNDLHFYTLNLEKVVYGILDGLGITKNALESVNEGDASSMVAKGSAWARVGDRVSTAYGTGTVQELDYGGTGAARIALDAWTLADGKSPTAFLQKGQYKKIL